VSSKCDWVSIEDQVNKLELSSVDLRCDPSDRRFTGSVSNVSRMSLDLSPLAPGKPFEVILDGQKISDIAWPTLSRAEGSAKPRAWLSCDNGKWSVMQTPSPQLKGPHRYGPFGEVFRNRVLFVYGTSGTEEENQWSLSKARFDAEDFWVNGNGSIDVVADVDFDPSSEPDRNVVLYGNRDCNSAWKKLLSDSPIQIERGRVQVGSKMLTGDDLVCCIVRPRPGSNIASVAEVAASGQRGRQLTYRLRYMRPGIDYPDFIVMSGSVDNVKVAGYFGSTWSLESAEVAWAE
jgi:hypothetical protein